MRANQNAHQAAECFRRHGLYIPNSTKYILFPYSLIELSIRSALISIYLYSVATIVLNHMNLCSVIGKRQKAIDPPGKKQPYLLIFKSYFEEIKCFFMFMSYAWRLISYTSSEGLYCVQLRHFRNVSIFLISACAGARIQRLLTFFGLFLAQ